MIRAVPSGVKFDLRAANGETVATSEVYTTEAACRRGIASVRKNAPKAGIEDQTEEKMVSNPKFQLFRDKSGAYRFRLRATNGQVIAVSEGYATKAGCLGGIESVRKSAAEAENEPLPGNVNCVAAVQPAASGSPPDCRTDCQKR